MHPADPSESPIRTINAAAPIRICDNGGWTDTWFARQGAVFNIAVDPCVHVQLRAARRGGQTGSVQLMVQGSPSAHRFEPGDIEGPHPLLQAAVAELPPPSGWSVEIEVFSAAPAGSSTGTSAAVAVALLGALDALRGTSRSRMELARLAHSVEVERLGLQSGVQDQLCAVHGGVNFIDIFDYPRARVSRVGLTNELQWELERRLVLIYLGAPHQSSSLHARVIASLESEGARAPRLDALRTTAVRSRDALLRGDFEALGQAMIDNTDAQAALHPDLISQAALRAIDAARSAGAVGWKVNGAGGEGGSVTFLAGPAGTGYSRLVEAVTRVDSAFANIPVRLCTRGMRVWELSETAQSPSRADLATGR